MAFDRDGKYFYARPHSVSNMPNMGEGNKYGAYSAMNNAFAEADMANRDEIERERSRRISMEERSYRDGREDVNARREDTNRQFTESGRQFDTKTNMFREMLARKMPDFFGAGSAPSAGGGYGQPDLIAYGGQQQRQAPGLDAATRNYLLRFLR